MDRPNKMWKVSVHRGENAHSLGCITLHASLILDSSAVCVHMYKPTHTHLHPYNKLAYLSNPDL